MAIALSMDAHIKASITDALRLRGVDVLTAQDDSNDTLTDDVLLDRATHLNRVLVTYDKGFRVMAEGWQRRARPFAGLIFAPQEARIGWLLEDLHVIAEASSATDFENFIQRLPYQRPSP